MIIGASSGIGECLAKKLAAKGARLLLMARRSDRLKRVAEECASIYKSHGYSYGTPSIFVGDITSQVDCLSAADECEKEMGGVDILILNAGISMDYSFDEMETLEDLKRIYGSMMDVNYFGNVFMTKAFATQLEQSKGQIVAISTGSGVLGLPRRTGYVASKHALHGFFNSLRNEWKQKGITISIICPGFVKTNIRAASVAGGRAKAAIDPKRSLMPVEDCCDYIIRAMVEHRKVYHIPVSSTIASILYPIPFLSDLVDMVLRRKMFREMPTFVSPKEA